MSGMIKLDLGDVLGLSEADILAMLQANTSEADASGLVFEAGAGAGADTDDSGSNGEYPELVYNMLRPVVPQVLKCVRVDEALASSEKIVHHYPKVKDCLVLQYDLFKQYAITQEGLTETEFNMLNDAFVLIFNSSESIQKICRQFKAKPAVDAHLVPYWSIVIWNEMAKGLKGLALSNPDLKGLEWIQWQVSIKLAQAQSNVFADNLSLYCDDLDRMFSVLFKGKELLANPYTQDPWVLIPEKSLLNSRFSTALKDAFYHTLKAFVLGERYDELAYINRRHLLPYLLNFMGVLTASYEKHFKSNVLNNRLFTSLMIASIEIAEHSGADYKYKAHPVEMLADEHLAVSDEALNKTVIDAAIAQRPTKLLNNTDAGLYDACIEKLRAEVDAYVLGNGYGIDQIETEKSTDTAVLDHGCLFAINRIQASKAHLLSDEYLVAEYQTFYQPHIHHYDFMAVISLLRGQLFTFGEVVWLDLLAHLTMMPFYESAISIKHADFPGIIFDIHLGKILAQATVMSGIGVDDTPIYNLRLFVARPIAFLSAATDLDFPNHYMEFAHSDKSEIGLLTVLHLSLFLKKINTSEQKTNLKELQSFLTSRFHPESAVFEKLFAGPLLTSSLLTRDCTASLPKDIIEKLIPDPDLLVNVLNSLSTIENMLHHSDPLLLSVIKVVDGIYDDPIKAVINCSHPKILWAFAVVNPDRFEFFNKLTLPKLNHFLKQTVVASPCLLHGAAIALSRLDVSSEEYTARLIFLQKMSMKAFLLSDYRNDTLNKVKAYFTVKPAGSELNVDFTGNSIPEGDYLVLLSEIASQAAYFDDVAAQASFREMITKLITQIREKDVFDSLSTEISSVLADFARWPKVLQSKIKLLNVEFEGIWDYTELQEFHAKLQRVLPELESGYRKGLCRQLDAKINFLDEAAQAHFKSQLLTVEFSALPGVIREIKGQTKALEEAVLKLAQEQKEQEIKAANEQARLKKMVDKERKRLAFERKKPVPKSKKAVAATTKKDEKPKSKPVKAAAPTRKPQKVDETHHAKPVEAVSRLDLSQLVYHKKVEAAKKPSRDRRKKTGARAKHQKGLGFVELLFTESLVSAFEQYQQLASYTPLIPDWSDQMLVHTQHYYLMGVFERLNNMASEVLPVSMHKQLLGNITTVRHFIAHHINTEQKRALHHQISAFKDMRELIVDLSKSTHISKAMKVVAQASRLKLSSIEAKRLLNQNLRYLSDCHLKFRSIKSDGYLVLFEHYVQEFAAIKGLCMAIFELRDSYERDAMTPNEITCFKIAYDVRNAIVHEDRSVDVPVLGSVAVDEPARRAPGRKAKKTVADVIAEKFTELDKHFPSVVKPAPLSPAAGAGASLVFAESEAEATEDAESVMLGLSDLLI